MKSSRAMPGPDGPGGTPGTSKASDKSILQSVGKEVKQKPPAILAKTFRKSGAKMANKQRVAIILSKARGKGARV